MTNVVNDRCRFVEVVMWPTVAWRHIHFGTCHICSHLCLTHSFLMIISTLTTGTLALF